MSEQITERAGEEPAGGFDGPRTAEERAAMFTKNMAIFEKYFAPLAARMKDHRPISKLVELEDGQPTIQFHGFDMYPEGAYTHAENQVANIARISERLVHGLISSNNLDLQAGAMYKRVEDEFTAAGFEMAGAPVRMESYFLIVFGIGLGVHLKPLLEIAKSKVVVLAESNEDFIYHSMFVTDWQELIEMLGVDPSLKFALGDNPDNMARSIQSIFRIHNPTGMDGARLYRHYNNSIFQEAERELRQTLRTAVMGQGFFQDEVNMIAQSYKNLEGGKARIAARMKDNPGIPAFIIGTGPSLEGLVDFIEENQDNAILFACGTSIDVLMGRGIRPDFWVMMERSYDIFPQAQETHELFDTSEVRFAGSTTIFPGVTDFFKESILFFRPGLSSAPLFSTDDDQIVNMPDPLAANAGAAFACHIGFREMYFMGVDCGSKYQSHGHAKGSWYERHDAENIKNLSIPLPGNLGGTVWTTQELQWSKETIERLIAYNGGKRFYNLGDGALIRGATPMHKKAIKLKAPKRGKPDLLQSIVETCPYYSQSDFDLAWEKAAVADRIYEYGDQLKAAVNDNRNFDDFEYVQQIIKCMNLGHVDEPIPMLLRGSVFGVMTAFECAVNRAKDAEERKAMGEIFRRNFCQMVDDICERGSEVFLGLEEGGPWEEFVE